MMHCPKCGSGQIVGPKYVSADWPTPECLRYTCLQCRYSSTTPTLDAKATVIAEKHP